MNTRLFLARTAFILALAISGAASAGIIGSSNVNVAIPDANPVAFGTVTSSFTVSDHGSVSDLTLTTAISHTSVGDLVISLFHDGVTVVVMSMPNSGANLSSTLPISFSDLATLPSSSTIGTGCAGNNIGGPGSCPNNAFLSLQALSAFNGTDMFGIWSLTVADHFERDVGTLAGWSLAQADAPASVPEPASLALFGLVLAGMAAARRQRGN